jgi:diaminopimelate epimerase
MNLTFYKYQGTGNDFVMIDNRNLSFPKEDISLINKLCDRHFGIGADGIILIEDTAESDFKMSYFNADGSETFCGNGGRCAVAFAKQLQMIDSRTNFSAFDGPHYAEIEDEIVSLQMMDVTEIKVNDNSVFTNTGTQHHVQLVDNLSEYPVFENGKKIRYSYEHPGSNVNFAEKINDTTFRVRTYEKGVENETLACGTGVTAVAIAMHKINKTTSNAITLPVEGGELNVTFNIEDDIYKDVYLKGPATFVFEGNITV